MKTHLQAATWLLSMLALAGCSTARRATPGCCASSEPVADPALQAPASADPTNGLAAQKEHLFATPFLSPDVRPALALDHRVTTHNGTATTLQALLDRPTAISFAYSRCANPNKCPRVVNAMETLRQDLDRAGLSSQVRLLLITYDPGFDTPAVLRRFARLNGLHLDDQALFLQPESDPQHVLFRDLGVRASFNDNGVAIHGIQLLLLDKRGRLARAYHTLLWDNQQVLADLEQLAAEVS